MNALFLVAVGGVVLIGIVLLSAEHFRESPAEQMAEPAPLSPTLQDTVLDIGEIRDARAMLERRGGRFSDGQIELYVFMRDAYQERLEAHS